jgi:hypothetical protein
MTFGVSAGGSASRKQNLQRPTSFITDGSSKWYKDGVESGSKSGSSTMGPATNDDNVEIDDHFAAPERKGWHWRMLFLVLAVAAGVATGVYFYTAVPPLAPRQCIDGLSLYLPYAAQEAGGIDHLTYVGCQGIQLHAPIPTQIGLYTALIHIE